MTLQNPTIS